MEIFLTFLLTVILGWLIYLSIAFARARKWGIQLLRHHSLEQQVREDQTTKQLMKILKELQIASQLDEEGRICFEYQKNNFTIEANDESLIISMWDVWWAGLKLDDSNIQKIKEAVNLSNMEHTVMTFYSIDKDKNLLGLHSKYDLVFSTDIANNNDLIKTVLEAFLQVQQDIMGYISQLNDNEAAQTTNERVKVKGFHQ